MKELSLQQARDFVKKEFPDNTDVEHEASNLLANARIVMSDVVDYRSFSFKGYTNSAKWTSDGLHLAVKALVENGILVKDGERYRLAKKRTPADLR